MLVNLTAWFQHTAARRRLALLATKWTLPSWFQHTAARRRLAADVPMDASASWFQHTAARRRLDDALAAILKDLGVSTHSRPKAAGFVDGLFGGPIKGFNTQPPEGGWNRGMRQIGSDWRFNTQPPEGGWRCARRGGNLYGRFNTQPPEGGWDRARHKAVCR